MQDKLKAIFTSHTVVSLEAQRFFGFSTETSLIQDHTMRVFQQLMPIRAQHPSYANEQVYDIQIYPADYYKQFNPSATFIKWAALAEQDSSLDELGLAKLCVPAGKYLCFQMGGREPEQFFSKLYTVWLPQSKYSLDHRPHFDKIWPDKVTRGSILKQEVYIPIQ